MTPLRTPDGRYIVVRGRLWRASDPKLPEATRNRLVNELMHARRAVKDALQSNDASRLAAARASVNSTKIALGERGPVWWNDEVDFHRQQVANTPYAEWYRNLTGQGARQPPQS
jgi:hypothetical protein